MIEGILHPLQIIFLFSQFPLALAGGGFSVVYRVSSLLILFACGDGIGEIPLFHQSFKMKYRTLIYREQLEWKDVVGEVLM